MLEETVDDNDNVDKPEVIRIDLVDDIEDVDVEGDIFVFAWSRFVNDDDEVLRFNDGEDVDISDCDFDMTWRYFNISVDKVLENL